VSRHRIHVDGFWGEHLAERLAMLAIYGGVAGCIGAVQLLPGAVLLIAIGGFVLIGPGSLVMSWFTDFPREAVYALIPVVGLSLSILVVTGLLLCGIYAPLPILLAMAVTTLGCGLLRRRRLGALEGLPS
jgi:hypothetical protein